MSELHVEPCVRPNLCAKDEEFSKEREGAGRSQGKAGEWETPKNRTVSPSLFLL